MVKRFEFAFFVQVLICNQICYLNAIGPILIKGRYPLLSTLSLHGFAPPGVGLEFFDLAGKNAKVYQKNRCSSSNASSSPRMRRTQRRRIRTGYTLKFFGTFSAVQLACTNEIIWY